MSVSRQVSVRLPMDLFVRLQHRTAQSSAFIVEAIRDKIARDEAAEAEESMKCLAYDDEANDISDFVEAQRRVMLRGD